jgi:zinc carboxypeptidase
MRLRSLLTLTLTPLLAGAVLTAPAQAQPAGAWPDLDPRPSNEKLAAQLDEIAAASDGRVAVRTIGTTNEGRPVLAARVGTGPVRIQYVTQQHGDEPLGTPAGVEFLRTVGVLDSPWQRWLRSRVTVDVIVRANPDGHAHEWRYNYDPTADPEYGEKGKGYDINRYHDPAVAPEDNPATEAGHIQRAFAEFQPRIVIDYHMQGRYTDDKGREITASLMWPTHPDVSADAVARAKQVVVVAEKTINHLGHGNVSQYPGGDYQGIARNGYGLRGATSVLLELSNMGAEHEQYQMRAAYLVMLTVAQTAADGSLTRVDPARADQIPPRGPEIP